MPDREAGRGLVAVSCQPGGHSSRRLCQLHIVGSIWQAERNGGTWHRLQTTHLLTSARVRNVWQLLRWGAAQVPAPRAERVVLSRGGGVELLDLVATDAADDLDPAPERGVLGELEERARGAVRAVRDREDEFLHV